MAVDLSMVGLDGIKAGQDTLTAVANRDALGANTQAQNLENQLTQQSIELDNLASQKLSQLATGKRPQGSSLFDGQTDESSAMPLEVLADTYFKGGAPTKGADFAKQAMEIRKKEQEIQSAAYNDQQTQLENIMKNADFVAQSIGVAQNDSEWAFGLKRLKDSGIIPAEQMEQLESMGYDPDVVAYFNDQATTAYQRAQLASTAAGRKLTQQNQDRQQANFERTQANADERLRLAQEAADRVEKVGKVAGAPDTNEIKSASAAVKNMIFGGVVPDSKEGDLESGAQSIAARAKALLQTDRSLSWETALNRAVIESKANGEWTQMEEQDTIAGIPYGKKTPTGARFDPIGKKPELPAPLPMTEDGKPDPKQLKKGQYYVTSRGRAQWDGSKFTLIGD